VRCACALLWLGSLPSVGSSFSAARAIQADRSSCTGTSSGDAPTRTSLWTSHSTSEGKFSSEPCSTCRSAPEPEIACSGSLSRTEQTGSSTAHHTLSSGRSSCQVRVHDREVLHLCHLLFDQQPHFMTNPSKTEFRVQQKKGHPVSRVPSSHSYSLSFSWCTFPTATWVRTYLGRAILGAWPLRRHCTVLESNSWTDPLSSDGMARVHHVLREGA